MVIVENSIGNRVLDFRVVFGVVLTLMGASNVPVVASNLPNYSYKYLLALVELTNS